MSNSTDMHIRDAVIKLETKMEIMSESISSMATSVAKLADMRYEVNSIKKDVMTNASGVRKVEANVVELRKDVTQLEKTQSKNSYVIGKIELFWGALITGAAGFLWWLVR